MKEKEENKIRILLVDDHAILRKGTRQLIENEPDMEVVGEAANGEEAISLAASLKPDLILLDVAMPGMSGIEVTRRVKEILPDTPVLVLTGYDYDEYVFSLLDIGAAGYLLKDVSGDELLKAIRDVYAGEPVLHPAIMRKLIDRFKMPFAKQVESSGSESLTDREIEVLKMAARGISNKDIASALVISVRTVQAHMRSIFSKLGVGSRSEAVICGLKKGLFTLDDDTGTEGRY